MAYWTLNLKHTDVSSGHLFHLLQHEVFMFENYTVPKELIPSDPRFGCGPSLIPVEFVQALAATGTELLGTSHRKPAVKNLVK
jgi:hypothetical protein